MASGHEQSLDSEVQNSWHRGCRGWPSRTNIISNFAEKTSMLERHPHVRESWPTTEAEIGFNRTCRTASKGRHHKFSTRKRILVDWTLRAHKYQVYILARLNRAAFQEGQGVHRRLQNMNMVRHKLLFVTYACLVTLFSNTKLHPRC